LCTTKEKATLTDVSLLSLPVFSIWKAPGAIKEAVIGVVILIGLVKVVVSVIVFVDVSVGASIDVIVAVVVDVTVVVVDVTVIVDVAVVVAVIVDVSHSPPEMLRTETLTVPTEAERMWGTFCALLSSSPTIDLTDLSLALAWLGDGFLALNLSTAFTNTAFLPGSQVTFPTRMSRPINLSKDWETAS